MDQVFTWVSLLLDSSSVNNRSSEENRLSGISVNRFPLKFNSSKEICWWKMSAGNLSNRLSSSFRHFVLTRSRKTPLWRVERRLCERRSSSKVFNPWKVPLGKYDMRLLEKSSNTRTLLAMNKLSGKVCSLFEDTSLVKEKYKCLNLRTFAIISNNWMVKYCQT